MTDQMHRSIQSRSQAKRPVTIDGNSPDVDLFNALGTLGHRKTGRAPRKGACTPFLPPKPALPLDPTVPQRHLHSPTTGSHKANGTVPWDTRLSRDVGNGAAVLQRKGPTAGAAESCEKPSAKREPHARQS